MNKYKNYNKLYMFTYENRYIHEYFKKGSSELE